MTLADLLASPHRADVLALIPDPAFLVDEDGRITAANEEAGALIGLSPDALLGRNVDELLPEDSRFARAACLRATRRRPSARRPETRRACRLRRADGTEVPVDVQLQPMTGDGPGEVLAVVREACPFLRGQAHGSAAARPDALARVERQNRELVEALEEVHLQLGLAAHDLRGPLAVVRAQAELFGSGEGEPSEVVPAAREVLAALDRMAGIVEDLLARSREGAERVRRERVDLAALVSRVVDLERHRARRRGVAVVASVEPAPVRVDPVGVERVVSNLLSNAIQASEPGTTVVVRAAPRDGEACIAVSDAGPGIDPDRLPDLFQPFVRGETSAEDGVGLGLASVRRIVEDHGGRVEVRSRLGAGSTFTVRLPAAGSE